MDIGCHSLLLLAITLVLDYMSLQGGLLIKTSVSVRAEVQLTERKGHQEKYKEKRNLNQLLGIELHIRATNV